MLSLHFWNSFERFAYCIDTNSSQKWISCNMCIAFAAELSSLASVILIKIAFFFRYSCYAGQIIF